MTVFPDKDIRVYSGPNKNQFVLLWETLEFIKIDIGRRPRFWSIKNASFTYSYMRATMY